MLRCPTLLAAGLMLGAALLVGCQTSNDDRSGDSTGTSSGGSSAATSGHEAPMMSKGVMCPKCRITYVRSPIVVPSYEGPRVVGYHSRKGPAECPECRKHAEGYFSSGKLTQCSTCGELEMIEPK